LESHSQYSIVTASPLGAVGGGQAASAAGASAAGASAAGAAAPQALRTVLRIRSSVTRRENFFILFPPIVKN
jgi:hypothetical protein